MARHCLKIIVLVLLGVVLVGAARGETVFPARTGRVVDEAGLLSQQARDTLTRQLAEHERTMSNQVVVVTVRSLQGMRIESYSLALANRWGVGQAGRNNGVVLLVAPNEREVRIEVGTGLGRRLSNAITADIIERRMLPAFRIGRPETGIQDGVSGILAALGDAYQMVERPRWNAQTDDEVDKLPVVIAVIAVLIVLAFVVAVLNAMTGGWLLNSLSSAAGNWRSDDDDASDRGSYGFGNTSRADRSSMWNDTSRHSSWGGGRSSGGGGGGSFRGGGASGRW